MERWRFIRGYSPQKEEPAKQCAPNPRFGVPDGYRAYDARGRTMTKVGDSSGKVYINPAYQDFVSNSHIDLWGVVKDLFFITVGSVSGGLGLVSSGTAAGATVDQTTRYAGAAVVAGAAADRAQRGAEAHPEDGHCVNN